MIFNCAGRASDGKSFPPFASGAQVKFEVSATFAEGAIIALVDPETSAVRQPLYDARKIGASCLADPAIGVTLRG